MTKKDNNSVYYKDWTTKKLKDEARSLDQLIYQVECYGSHDLQELDGIMQELDARGVEISSQITFN